MTNVRISWTQGFLLFVAVSIGACSSSTSNGDGGLLAGNGGNVPLAQGGSAGEGVDGIGTAGGGDLASSGGAAAGATGGRDTSNIGDASGPDGTSGVVDAAVIDATGDGDLDSEDAPGTDSRPEAGGVAGPFCGSGSVSCSFGTCPANGGCTTDNMCSCPSGYEWQACDGTPRNMSTWMRQWFS